MKEKTKATLKDSLKYFRELSVVVVGIAITFTVSDCIGRKNEQRELQRYLDAVKLELEDNLKITEESVKLYDQTAKLAFYLSSNKIENLKQDSIEKYSYAITFISFVTYKTSAFEMLKTSGAMRLIKDKVFLSAIWNAYAIMEESKTGNDRYMQRKMDEMYNTVLESHVVMDETFLAKISKPEYRRLLEYLSIYINLEKQFQGCAGEIQSTLEKFPE